MAAHILPANFRLDSLHPAGSTDILRSLSVRSAHFGDSSPTAQHFTGLGSNPLHNALSVGSTAQELLLRSPTSLVTENPGLGGRILREDTLRL